MRTFNIKLAAFVSLSIMLLLSTGCMKDFLDIKRDKSQVIPVTLEDYRSIFENETMNFFSPHQLGEIGSDDYFIQPDIWQALSSPVHRNSYVWADEIFQSLSSEDWNRGYEKILHANFVLEGIEDINETPENKRLRDEVIGTAHFFRGTTYFHLAQLFCKQYDVKTARENLGLPIRTSSNINVKYQRASLEETYTHIFGNLKKASLLLPSEISLNTRPFRAAAWGMLANVHLQVGDYSSASNYADSALALASEILDYNDVNTTLPNTFPLYGQHNKEIIFNSLVTRPTILTNTRIDVDSLLYQSYKEGDIRKQAFFSANGGRNVFKGSYSGTPAGFFTGLTAPELLLVRAECNARLGNPENAIEDLNWLLSNRYVPEKYKPIEDNISQEALLELILSERRKELIFRGKRWQDLKRFLTDPLFALPLKRVLDGVEYTLPINSQKWVWPIPPDVIDLGGILQNDR